MIKAIARKLLDRKPDTHKGDYGRIFVIAGSSSYTGAAYLAGQAALLAGAGLVTLGVPKSIYPILASKLTEVMVRPFFETRDASLSLMAEKEIVDFALTSDVVAIGPGLSMNKETQQLARHVIAKVEKPCVVDADGVSSLQGHLSVLKTARHPIVLTPHPGELARLLTVGTVDVQRDRNALAIDFSREYNVVLVLKGHGTVVANPSGESYVNTTGNPGMATAGAGDVLTGIIAGFIGQGLAPFEAAVLGTYVHGFAGDLAAKEKGMVSVIASDLLQKLPEAIKSV